MTLQELRSMMKKMECGEIEFRGRCHDCKAEISVTAGIEQGEPYTIGGGAIYQVSPQSPDDAGIYIKCKECFEKDKVLRNWRKTEVFSRVVGYLRPIGQWNKGKKAEWDIRKMVKINKEIKNEEKNNDR